MIRRLQLALLAGALACLGTPLFAQVPEAAVAPQEPAAQEQPAQQEPAQELAAEAGADLWDFEEEAEEPVPTWRDAVRAQSADFIVFPLFAALALVSFFRKSVKLKYATLLVSVIYLGVFRSQLISITNIFALLSGNLPLFTYSPFWYLFAAFTVLTTVLWGRVYCGRICAFGALTQLMDAILPAWLRREPPRWLEQRASYVKYGILAMSITYFLATRDIAVHRYVEPFWMFTGYGTPITWTMVGLLLAASVVVRNVYCRFLCPVGAFLGLMSSVTTVFRIKRWKECTNCRICQKTCEWGAIRNGQIVRSECVRCDDCERLYMDEQKCPHWIIIRRRGDVEIRRALARQKLEVGT